MGLEYHGKTKRGFTAVLFHLLESLDNQNFRTDGAQITFNQIHFRNTSPSAETVPLQYPAMIPIRENAAKNT